MLLFEPRASCEGGAPERIFVNPSGTFALLATPSPEGAEAGTWRAAAVAKNGKDRWESSVREVITATVSEEGNCFAYLFPLLRPKARSRAVNSRSKLLRDQGHEDRWRPALSLR